MKKIIILLLLLTHLAHAQQRAITLEEIYGTKSNTFTAKTVTGVNWMKQGGFYTSLQPGQVVKYSIATGEAVETLFDQNTATVAGGSDKITIEGYQLSPDERKLLLTTEEEPIYRRSKKAEYFVYDLGTKSLVKLSKNGKQQYASFSPDGTKVAFVRENNLYMVDLTTQIETALTTDGKFNEIINGGADWVYEEEFSLSKAFAWSPDGRRIAYYRFDETAVPEYNMQVWKGLYPQDYKFKYPKAGEPNATVQILVYALGTKQTTKMDIGSETDQYIPRIEWTKNPNLLSIRRMNRLQNRLDLLHADATTGQARTILTEEADTYVDLIFTDDLTYLDNGEEFIFSSERSGYKHLYLYNMDGTLDRQLTSGGWEVAEFLGIDEPNNLIYYTSTDVSPLERHLYRQDIAAPKRRRKRYQAPPPVRLSDKRGINRILLNPDFQYYLEYNSSTQAVPTVTLRQAPTAAVVRTLETNRELFQKLAEYRSRKPEFFQFTTSESVTLNGWMIKPAALDPAKKYPVLMFVYGGPGSQTVVDSWESRDFLWHQTLADKGYLVVSIDNRGTGARGKAFRTATYAQLGKLETQDQIEGAKYLGTLPYVDKDRIGIWGWSYGGYMASLCLTVGADYFKAGIAVAPVTTWRFYDSIYTERYLKRPQDNPSPATTTTPPSPTPQSSKANSSSSTAPATTTCISKTPSSSWTRWSKPTATLKHFTIPTGRTPYVEVIRGCICTG